jgi:ribosomal protein S18 acetylase RimI-like enzyme
MSDQPKVRTATPDDLEACLHLWRHLEEYQGAYRMFPLVADAAQRAEMMFKEAVEDPDTRVFLVDSSGRSVGMLVAHRTQSKGFSHAQTVDLSKVVIENTHRNRGIGRMLVEAAEEFALESGATYLTARVFSDNLAGTGFWGALQFEPRYEERARPVRRF